MSRIPALDSSVDAASKEDVIATQAFQEEMKKSVSSIQAELVTQFNCTVRDFVKALINDFKHLEDSLKMMYNKYLIALKFSEAAGINAFRAGLMPHSKLIENRDEKFIMEETRNIPLIQDLQLHTVWPTASGAKRNTIWTMTQKLTGLANTHQAAGAVVNQQTMSAVGAAMNRLQLGKRATPPKLDEMAAAIAEEMSFTSDEGKKAELKAEISRFTKNILPQQIDQISRFIQQRGHSPGDAEKARQMLMQHLANM